MSEEKRESVQAFGQMADELRLQAWLAAADFRNPSLDGTEAREEVDALAALRDEFRLQMHLGRLEARDEWHQAEKNWRELKHQASQSVDAVGEGIRELLGRIRASYEALGSTDET